MPQSPRWHDGRRQHVVCVSRRNATKRPTDAAVWGRGSVCVEAQCNETADCVAKTGTLTFAPGETTKTITIVVKSDSKKEADETFYLDLFGNSGNSLFTKNRGLGTILNDD
ncbi:MAG: hypothetical protein HYX43_07890 [Burkholderiales bacterium]|nr:hypothetical protein [Burkholderiales bacterium]